MVRGEVDHTLNENILEFNAFQDNLHSFTDDLLAKVFGNLLGEANQGVKAYKDLRDSHFKKIEEEKRKKQEEIERKAREKRQKEIEEQRKKKFNKLVGKSEMSVEQTEIELAAILDCLDGAPGL